MTLSIDWIIYAPFVCVASAAVLFYVSLRDRERITWRFFLGGIAVLLVACGAMFLLALFEGWATVGALYIAFLSSIEMLVGGIVLLVLVPGWRKLWVALIVIAYPAAMFAAIWGARPHSIAAQTQRRAEPIIAALDTYHARNGNYPESLSELVPEDLPELPEQETMWGWLYQTGGDEFQLGYIEDVDQDGYSVTMYSSRDQMWDYVPSGDNPFRDLPPTPVGGLIPTPTP